MDPTLPTVHRCILHLRLLAAFARLRDSIRGQDGLFGCYDNGVASHSDLRWTIFVAKAVDRFEKWHDAVLKRNGITNKHWKAAGRDADDVTAVSLLESPPSESDWIIPPLDVLMVLHSYMLNPRIFLDDCLRRGSFLMDFPWDCVEASLDSDTLAFKPQHHAIKSFEQTTGESWEPAQDALVNLQCHSCSTPVPVSGKILYARNHDQSEKGNIRTSFEAHCPACKQAVTQEFLILARVRKDILTLGNMGVPMPGTLLSKNGLVLSNYRSGQPGIRQQPYALNALLDPSLLGDSTGQDPEAALQLFWTSVEEKIATSDEASQPQITTALRRMMARYHNNHSPFGLDLVGAVLRQGTFITKMQDFDWVHSPGLKHTVAQAIERYKGFFAVIAAYPGKMAVPTFDVDLVWHTHQLLPSDYYEYSINICNGVFIDHDDKIGDGVLTDSFGWTCQAFENITGKKYDKCLCWACKLLEQKAMQPLAVVGAANSSGSLKSRIRNKIRKPTAKQQLSSEEIEVIRLQLLKFEKDFANATTATTNSDGVRLRKLDYYQTYQWHHPDYAPLPQELLP